VRVQNSRPRRGAVVVVGVVVAVVVLAVIWLALQTLGGESSRNSHASGDLAFLIGHKEFEVAASLAHIHLDLLAIHEELTQSA
jgi:hypothetical protein